MGEYTFNQQLFGTNNIHNQVEETWTPLRAAAAVATTVTLKHFAADKLGEFADKVLVLARSEREVEKCLAVDRFHEQLHKREEVNA
jgi:hypothetical protein